jgi:DNA-binding response OmpR family regulator
VTRGRFLVIVADAAPDAMDELADQLAAHHIDTEVYAHPGDALLQVGSQRPDAVIVAAELPSMSSTEVVRVLSQRAWIPVLVGVGDSDGDAAAAALAAGATACVPRPYRARDIIPFLRAIRPETVGGLDPPMALGALTLDPATLEVHLHGRLIRLPLREFQLLRFFMTHANRVVTREQIQASVWPDLAADTSNTITVHIKRLRRRLGDAAVNPRIIVTARGMGYRLVPPVHMTGPPADHGATTSRR